MYIVPLALLNMWPVQCLLSHWLWVALHRWEQPVSFTRGNALGSVLCHQMVSSDTSLVGWGAVQKHQQAVAWTLVSTEHLCSGIAGYLSCMCSLCLCRLAEKIWEWEHLQSKVLRAMHVPCQAPLQHVIIRVWQPQLMCLKEYLCQLPPSGSVPLTVYIRYTTYKMDNRRAPQRWSQNVSMSFGLQYRS